MSNGRSLRRRATPRTDTGVVTESEAICPANGAFDEDAPLPGQVVSVSRAASTTQPVQRADR